MKELKKYINKFNRFSEETSLMLYVVHPSFYLYSENDQDLIVRKVVESYFENDEVKKRLTVVDGVSKNLFGEDVRIVAREMLDNVIKEEGVVFK